MVPKLFRAGKSFKGVFRYLATDPKANTSERVEWTHTLNCAYDDVKSALDEMIWTARSADWLKRQAGGRTGGAPLKDPVRHFSLNWHRSEKPSREHMIATVESFLRHMKWDEHQAVIFCHKDKRHDHVHVVLNAVHPETGRALDARFDRSRAQQWALAYEQEHGLHCEQRLQPKEEREKSPTREAWQKMQQGEQQFEKEEAARAARAPEYFERGDDTWKRKEWDPLRGYQKDQRTDFFAGGKKAYREVRNAVFREVRSEFRDEWRTWFALRREGFDPNLLGEIKKGILERQNAELEQRRDAACGVLRGERDEQYRALLDVHAEHRAELKQRQHQGLRSFDLLDRAYQPAADGPANPNQQDQHALDRFKVAGEELCEPRKPVEQAQEEQPREREPFTTESHERHKVRDPANAIGDLGLGALGALATVAERLLEGFFGGGAKATAPEIAKPILPRQRDQDDSRARAAEKQLRMQEAEVNEARQLQAFWEERRHRRRSRDRD